MPRLLLLVALIGGAIYFLVHYEVEGLDALTIHPKQQSGSGESEPSDLEDLLFVSAEAEASGADGDSPEQAAGDASPTASRPPRSLRIASWSLSGFGPSKLASDHVRQYLVRLIRSFDVIALQQVSGIERDLIPRLVEEVNEGGRTYEFVLGAPSGPRERPEVLAILFNLDRVHIDRTQTYTVADPEDRMTYDPLVAWFRAAGVSPQSAWTFSLVNTRINLSRAPAEVALLPGIAASVRADGRGEDDVVMAGLFQADDAYLVRRVMGEQVVPAVRSRTTDIFNRHQTCNVLIDRERTSEFIGRGGPLDFLRLFNLTLTEAEAISSHLPVFAEFSPIEGGQF
jgi:hypothetical protein